MEPDRPATYGGPGFRRRSATLQEEVREGRIWSAHAVDSEWTRLLGVVLHLPGPSIEAIEDPDESLMLERLDHARLRGQHEELVRVLEGAGVRVLHVDHAGVDDRRYPNLIFQRDLFFMTPFGAVVSRMAGLPRAGEERYLARTLADEGVPIALTVGGTGTLEGADCLWLAPDRVLCGVGARTNEEGFRQLQALLAANDVDCVSVPVPHQVQHLLGLLQIVGPRRALVRGDLASIELMEELSRCAIDVTPFAESREIAEALAFNFLVIDRNRVIAPQ
jgi:N-dimethylarginine dimethylaminohydrolase